MKNGIFMMTLYRTTIDGDWQRVVCKTKLRAGALAGVEPAGLTRLVQKQLGISDDAAMQLVTSIFTSKSGVS